MQQNLAAALVARTHAPTLMQGLLRMVLDPFAAARATAGEQRASLGLRRQIRVADGLAALAEEADTAYPLAAVCAELGVSLRTLNDSSNAVLGMGAGLYLRRRRLHRVHEALRRGEGSVTEAATAQGFYDLGRFAGDYRVLFGCNPSDTLRQGAARKAEVTADGSEPERAGPRRMRPPTGPGGR